MTEEIRDYCAELKNEYVELTEIFDATPEIDINDSYDCVTNLEGKIEKLVNQQNKKLFKQAKKNLIERGIQFHLSFDKKTYILNQFKDFLYDFRIFPRVEDYESALKCNTRSGIRRIRESVKENWSYEL